MKMSVNNTGIIQAIIHMSINNTGIGHIFDKYLILLLKISDELI